MRRVVLLLTLVGALLLACSGVALAQPAGPSSSQSSQSQKFAPDRVIVKLKEGASSRALEERNRGIGARTEKRIAPHTVPRLHTVKLPQGVSVERAIEHYKASRDVEYAEPDFFVYHDATTTDPYYTDGSLWGLNNTGQNSGTNDADVDAPEAWNVVDTTNDEEIVVAVIDEGVDYNHPDLAGNIWKNPGETGTDSQGRNKETNGVDDDGNRYVDDVRGYDFYYNDNSTYDGSADNHGTHVAGTIGALGNTAGVVGVNYAKVKLITAKFLGANGGYTSDAIEAVDYVTDLKKNRGVSNLTLSSNSWGGGGYSQGLYDAISRADAADILFVAAAGNGGSDGVGDNNDTTPHYPSSYNLRNVIAVAATDRNDAKSSFSNYGSTSVDLGAPGSSIYSTLPDNTYGSYSGTSMATPHVSGSLTLLMSREPTLISTDDGHIQAKDRIFNNVDPASSLSGKTVTGGRLNVAKTLGVTPPDTVPTVSSTTPSDGKTGVGRGNNVTATFSEAINSATLSKDTFTLVKDGTTTLIGATVTLSSDGKQATLDPSARLASCTWYKATVTTDVKDKAGNALDQDPNTTGNQLKSWSFKTRC